MLFSPFLSLWLPSSLLALGHLRPGVRWEWGVFSIQTLPPGKVIPLHLAPISSHCDQAWPGGSSPQTLQTQPSKIRAAFPPVVTPFLAGGPGDGPCQRDEWLEGMKASPLLYTFRWFSEHVGLSLPLTTCTGIVFRSPGAPGLDAGAE